MPFFALLLGIILVFGLHRLFKAVGQGKQPARWVLGGGAFVSLLLASRIFGASLLYVFLPFLQRWMMKSSSENAQMATSSNAMSPQEAAMVLGVEVGARKAEINQAYKELMRKLHPDQGGNDYLAGKLNQAREVLLRHK
jgi:hypothetical protein